MIPSPMEKKIYFFRFVIQTDLFVRLIWCQWSFVYLLTCTLKVLPDDDYRCCRSRTRRCQSLLRPQFMSSYKMSLAQVNWGKCAQRRGCRSKFCALWWMEVDRGMSDAGARGGPADVTQTRWLSDWAPGSRFSLWPAAEGAGNDGTSALLPSLLRLPPSPPPPPPPLERGRRSERRITGAARSVSTGEPLAWCSVQPASLCGRAAHASAEAPKQPGLGVVSDFPLKPWEKNVLRIYGQQHPCQPRRAPRTRIPAEEHHRLGTVARRRLSATSSLTGPGGDWWLIALLLRQATMLRTSTLATGLLFLGFLHSLQVIAPGWAIDGELIGSCAARSVCVCVCLYVCVCLQVTNVDRRNVEGMKHITVAFCSCPQTVRATYEY